MRKNITNYRYTKTFSILAAIFLSSFLFLTCKISFESDLKGYLKDYTEKVEIIDYTTNIDDFESKSIKKDAEGYKEYYIPSTKDFTITFTIRNPQQYKLTSKYLGVDLNLFDKYSNYLNDIEIKQTGTYQLTLTIPNTFLKDAEKGENITPSIRIANPNIVTDTPDFKSFFDTYESLHIVCNSEPIEITSPTVYKNNSTEQYALIFNMPGKSALTGTGIHSDINQLIVYSDGNDNPQNNINYTYTLTPGVNQDHTDYFFTLTPKNSPEIGYGNPTDKDDQYYDENYVQCGPKFDKENSDQPVYIITDKAPKGKVNYHFILKDKYGLTSKDAVAQAYSIPRLSAPYVIDSNNKLMQKDTQIKQDSGSSYATLKILPSMFTYYFEGDNGIQNVFRYINKDGERVTEDFEFDDTQFSSSNSNFNNVFNAALKELQNEQWMNGNWTPDSGKTYKQMIDSWTLNSDTNTSDATLSFKIYEGSDHNGTLADNGTFTFAKSTGKRPSRTKNNDGSITINFSGNDLLSSGHYYPVEVPCGPICISIYTTHDGNSDSLIYEFPMEVLRTRVYAGSTDGNNSNPGTYKKPFATINYAASKLSVPTDTGNTIYLLDDITENVEIPVPYIKISSNTGSIKYSINSEDDNTPVITIPENATVILENLKVSGNIIVGKGAKLYLNNVEMDKGIIEANEDSRVILGGTTTIKAVLDDKGNPLVDKQGYPTSGAWILLSSTAKVQLGVDNEYNSRGQATFTSPSIKYNEETAELVLIRTEENFPELNTVIIESESPKTTAVLPTIFKEDLEREDNPCQFFKLVTPGYYIKYSGKDGSSTKGKGVTGIPAAKVIEPEIGGFTIELDTNLVENNVWTYQLSTRSTHKTITAKIMKGDTDYTKIVTNRKFQLAMEGDLITNGTFSVTDGKAFTMTIPYLRTICPAGKYTLTVLFDYDGITYSDELLLNLVE